MENDSAERHGSPAAYVLMALVLFWSGALAAGFAWAAGTGEMGPTRTVAFYGLAIFLALIAGRTAYELARRIRGIQP